MNDYISTKNKFFCQVCHSYFEKGKNAIGEHERSQKHKRAKDRETKHLLRKPKEKTEEQKYEEEVQYLNDRNARRYSGAPAPTTNKPNAPKGAGPKTDKHQGPPGESGYGKRGDDKPLPRQELGISLKETEGFVAGGNMFGGVWTLAKDEDTGKLVFYNRRSGIKHTERPRGVRLSPEDEKKWEEYQKNPTQSADLILDPTIAQGTVGEWEAVDATEDFYAANAIDPRILDAPEEEYEDEEERKLDEKLEQNLDRIGEMNQEEINELLNLDKPEEGKSLLKAKTDKLKKLIDSNIETVSKPTFQKDSDILFKRNLENRGFDGDEGEGGAKGGNMFKKRKPQGNKRVILGFDNENEIE